MWKCENNNKHIKWGNLRKARYTRRVGKCSSFRSRYDKHAVNRALKWERTDTFEWVWRIAGSLRGLKVCQCHECDRQQWQLHSSLSTHCHQIYAFIFMFKHWLMFLSCSSCPFYSAIQFHFNLNCLLKQGVFIVLQESHPIFLSLSYVFE